MDKIVINWKRVKGNFALLIPVHREETFPYLSNYLERVPHRMVNPKLLPDWTANDWFYVTHLLRGKVQSHMATAKAIELRKTHPELFDPKQAMHFSAEEIDEVLKQVFGSVPPRQLYGEAWRRNSEILLHGWGGDIRNVYDSVTTEEEVRARVVNKENYKLPFKERGFYMFQAKMTALLTINLMRAGFIPRISMSFPVDFHHMRALIGTGMITLPNGSYRPDSIEAAGDRIGREYLDRFPEMDPVTFSEFLFVLSREGCVRAITDPEVDWNDPEVIGRYERGCGRCPLEHRCEQTVVTGDYYVRDRRKGPRLITVIPRPKPPARIRRRGG